MENQLIFNDLKTAFNYKGNRELRSTWMIFKILQYPFLVKTLTLLATLILKYNLPFKFFIRKTIFRVFCSGENVEEAFKTVKLRRFPRSPWQGYR